MENGEIAVFGGRGSEARASLPLCFLPLHFPDNPGHQQIYDLFLLPLVQPDARRDAVPLVQTAAAAAGAGVLGREDWMASHGGLPAVVGNAGGGEALGHKFPGVVPNDFQPLLPDIVPLLYREVELRPEGGGLELVKGLVDGLHRG